MKILITGSNGFLGSYLKRDLSKQHDVLGTSRKNADFNVDLALSIPDFKNSFELVIHAAGLAHTVPKNELEKSKFYETNLLGTTNLLTALERSGSPKRFVFISSVSVYGLTSGLNIDENAALGATDAYGLSKIKAEQLIEEWCNKYRVVCTILRLPLLIGPSPKGNLLKMINSIKAGYYFDIENVNPQKSMLLIRDLVPAIILASQNGGTFNLTDGYHPRVHELSQAIANRLHKNINVKIPYWIAKTAAITGDLLGDRFPINKLKLKKLQSTLTFDDSKARASFNWDPSLVLKNLDFLNEN